MEEELNLEELTEQEMEVVMTVFRRWQLNEEKKMVDDEIMRR